MRNIRQKFTLPVTIFCYLFLYFCIFSTEKFIEISSTLLLEVYLLSLSAKLTLSYLYYGTKIPQQTHEVVSTSIHHRTILYNVVSTFKRRRVSTGMHLWIVFEDKNNTNAQILKSVGNLKNFQMKTFKSFLGNIYLIKFNNGNTRKRYEICSRLAIKTERRHLRRFSVFIVNFEHISYLFLGFFIADFKQLHVSWVVEHLRLNFLVKVVNN